MGRRKIEIQPITHERNRAVTFLKRKNGLFKKAYELGVLCSVDVAVVIFEKKGQKDAKLWTYSSCSDVKDIVQRQLRFSGEKDNKTAIDFGGSASSGGAGSKRGAANDDDDDDGENEEGEDEDEYVPPSSHKKAGSLAKAKPEDTKAAESMQGMDDAQTSRSSSYPYNHRPSYSDPNFAHPSQRHDTHGLPVPVSVDPNTGVPFTAYTYPPPSHPHSHHHHLPSSHSPVYADRRPPYSDQRYQPSAPSPTYGHASPYGDFDAPPAKRQRIMTGAYPTSYGYRLSASTSAPPERNGGVVNGLDLFAGLFGSGETRGAERRSIDGSGPDREVDAFDWPVHNPTAGSADGASQRSGASASPTGSTGGQTASWLDFLSASTTSTNGTVG